MAESHTFFAVSPPGLETLVRDELEQAGFAPGRVLPGGVEWEGPLSDALRANLLLRLPNRVLVRFASFHAASFPDLFRAAARQPWAAWLPDATVVRFRVTSHRSRLYHTGGIAERLADGLARRLPGAQIDIATAQGAGGSDEADDLSTGLGAGDRAAHQLIVARLERDQVSLSFDASGELLSRRGYRQATAKAPLRENLAAALLLAAGWQGEGVLIDPFCGSGTIAIEAAEIALGLAPGRNRTFACERWTHPGCARAADVRAEAVRPRPQGTFRVLASDRVEGALKALEGNAKRAGVLDVIEASRGDFLHLVPPAETGWLVTNPPYGVRVRATGPGGSGAEQLVLRLRAAWAGWRAALLVPWGSSAWSRVLSGPEHGSRSFRTRNGGLDVALRAGVVGAGGSGRAQRSP